MKRIVFAAALLAALAVPAIARAAGSAYYFADKVAATCAEGKANATAQQKDIEAKNAQIKKAQAEAAKSHGDAAALSERLRREFSDRQQADAAKLYERMWRVAALVRKAAHVDALLPVGSGADVDPRLDLTAKVVELLDQGKGVSQAEAEAALRKQLAEVTAERDRLKAQQHPAPKK